MFREKVARAEHLKMFRERVARMVQERLAACDTVPEHPEEGEVLNLGGVPALVFRDGAWDAVSDPTGAVHETVLAHKAAQAESVKPGDAQKDGA